VSFNSYSSTSLSTIYELQSDQSTNWFDAVNDANLDAVYVYAGDVEFYCKGSPTATKGGGASPPNTDCIFNTNAFVYYTEVAQKAAATFKKA